VVASHPVLDQHQQLECDDGARGSSVRDQQPAGDDGSSSVAIHVDRLLDETPLLPHRCRLSFNAAAAAPPVNGTAGVGRLAAIVSSSSSGGQSAAVISAVTASRDPSTNKDLLAGGKEGADGRLSTDSYVAAAAGKAGGVMRGVDAGAAAPAGSRLLLRVRRLGLSMRPMRVLGGRGGRVGSAFAAAVTAAVTTATAVRGGGRHLAGVDGGLPVQQGAGGSANDHLVGFTGITTCAQQFGRARVEPKTFFANERTFLQV